MISVAQIYQSGFHETTIQAVVLSLSCHSHTPFTIDKCFKWNKNHKRSSLSSDIVQPLVTPKNKIDPLLSFQFYKMLIAFSITYTITMYLQVWPTSTFSCKILKPLATKFHHGSTYIMLTGCTQLSVTHRFCTQVWEAILRYHIKKKCFPFCFRKYYNL
jgi:hypothetical protein